jgi:hypothetical protein
LFSVILLNIEHKKIKEKKDSMKRLKLIVIIELFCSLFFIPLTFTGPLSHFSTRVDRQNDIKNYENNVKYHEDLIGHHEIFQKRHAKTAEIYRKNGKMELQNVHLKLANLHEEAKDKHQYAKIENEKEIQRLNIKYKNRIRSALMEEHTTSPSYAGQLTEKARTQSQLTHHAESDHHPLKETEDTKDTKDTKDTQIPSK